MSAQNTGGEKRAKEASRPQDFTRPLFYLTAYLRSSSTDEVKEELLVLSKSVSTLSV